MKLIQITPLHSAMGIQLGWTREQTHQKIGEPDRSWEQSDHYQSELPMFSVDYDSNNTEEFISISNPENKATKVLFEGLDIFGTPAVGLIEEIEKHTAFRYDRNSAELPYTYIFPEIELSFWRPVVSGNENAEEGFYFKTVGVGVKGCYTE